MVVNSSLISTRSSTNLLSSKWPPLQHWEAYFWFCWRRNFIWIVGYAPFWLCYMVQNANWSSSFGNGRHTLRQSLCPCSKMVSGHEGYRAVGKATYDFGVSKVDQHIGSLCRRSRCDLYSRRWPFSLQSCKALGALSLASSETDNQYQVEIMHSKPAGLNEVLNIHHPERLYVYILRNITDNGSWWAKIFTTFFFHTKLFWWGSHSGSQSRLELFIATFFSKFETREIWSILLDHHEYMINIFQ